MDDKTRISPGKGSRDADEQVQDLKKELARQERAAFDKAEKLKIAYLSTVKALVRAIEIKDPYTRGHYELVSRYACSTARQMGLDADVLDRVRIGGMLMDIGKIAIDSRLLIKKTPLSEEEFEIIRTHVRIGAEITDPIVYPWEISRLIYQHHERFDGSGYPEGIAGDRIMVEAQILGICDSFVAMMADRAFREAYSKSFTVDTLKDESGRKFSPKVAEAFVQVVEGGKSEIMEDFARFFDEME